jgi:hypothetical protein
MTYYMAMLSLLGTLLSWSSVINVVFFAAVGEPILPRNDKTCPSPINVSNDQYPPVWNHIYNLRVKQATHSISSSSSA